MAPQRPISSYEKTGDIAPPPYVSQKERVNPDVYNANRYAEMVRQSADERSKYVEMAFQLAFQHHVKAWVAKLMPDNWWHMIKDELVPELERELKIVVIGTTTGMAIGAIIGGIAGSFAIPVVGTAVGAAIGAFDGAAVGLGLSLLYLKAYGILQAVEMAPMLLDKLKNSLELGIKTAWESEGSMTIIYLAASQLGFAIAVFLGLLLSVVLALVVRKGAAMLANSKLLKHPKISNWVNTIAAIRSLGELRQLSGLKEETLRRMSELCKRERTLRVFRVRNVAALRYEGKPGFTPKPLDLKAHKSSKSGPNEGLMVVAEKPTEKQLKEIDQLLKKGWTIKERNGEKLLVDPKGNFIYSDIDRMGAYQWVEGKGFGPAGYRKGKPYFDNDDFDKVRADNFAMKGDYFQHGNQDRLGRTEDGRYVMRPEPGDSAGLSVVREPGRRPDADEKFLVCDPDGNFTMMDVCQLRDFYYSNRIYWPYD